MAQGFNQKPKIGIIGAGPAGCTVAYFLKKYADITIIDYSTPMRTILPTGGGRCNLAYAEFDFRELVKNYPRGEKFLYSIFSKFSTSDTIELFENLGLKTYIQDDMRMFPESNSAKDVQEVFLNSLKSIIFKREKALRIEPFENSVKLITDSNSYSFDELIIASGGNCNYEMLSRIDIDIVKPCPALVGLNTTEKLEALAGVKVSNVFCEGYLEDILFTHTGVTGPLVFKISSIKARDKMPYNLSFDLYPREFNLQEMLNDNSQKNIDNLLSELLPKKLVMYILKKINISNEAKAHKINALQRDSILDLIHNFTVTILGTRKDGEVVTAGGVNLKDVCPKTLESKKHKRISFVGEVLDIDGFCGGFNLQNCWSTAYVVSEAIKNKY